MRDFDKEREERALLDYTFKVNGTVLRFRKAVPAEVFAKYADVLQGTYRALYPIPGETNENGEPILLYRPPTEVEVVELLDEIAYDYLEQDSHGAWKDAREHRENPLTYAEQVALINYMVSVQAGRPTMPASASGPGDERQDNGTKSTAESQPLAAT